jgi:uncharacterized protein (DUF362 family)
VQNRRNFIRTTALAAGGAAALPIRSLASRYQTQTGFFGLHEFIENNPHAVFIMKTNVDVKTNGAAIKQAAQAFARQVFVPKTSGVPLTTLIPVKPNLTDSSTTVNNLKTHTLEYGMGIVTDPYFCEGVIEGIKELGVSGSQFYIREVNGKGDFGPRGYMDVTATGTYARPDLPASIGMATRVGAEIRYMDASIGTISANDVVWKDVPNGVWFKKIPYLWPINADNSWLVSIAKFKTHGMGVTLSAKNLQGTIAHNYQAHCTAMTNTATGGMNIDAANKVTTAFKDIQNNYNRHVSDGVPRWAMPGNSSGGIWQETWASRCIDNNSINKPGIHIIEGVYGRDGGGFLTGPNPSPANDDNKNGEAWDYMSNIIIFGKDPFANDVVGHWLAGHEPGNFGLFYLAKERGLCRVINPMKIPVYEWKPSGEVIYTPLTEFARTPLKTYFLQKNYNGGTEKYWHMCDEPCTYPSNELMAVEEKDRPEAFALHQNIPNPFNPRTSIEYSLPGTGAVRLEVFNSAGQMVDVLVDGVMPAGNHLAVWDTRGRASGTYFYRLRFGGFTETKKMTLLK